jgi:hypothetical protein
MRFDIVLTEVFRQIVRQEENCLIVVEAEDEQAARAFVGRLLADDDAMSWLDWESGESEIVDGEKVEAPKLSVITPWLPEDYVTAEAEKEEPDYDAGRDLL